MHWPACAKVVPLALEKSMRQVLSEIMGDHADAMRQGTEDNEQLGRKVGSIASSRERRSKSLEANRIT